MGCSKKQLPYIAASLFLFVGGILFFAFPMRNLVTYYMDQGILIVIPIIAIIYMGLLYLFVVSTFFLASFVDPGIYPREHTDEEDDYRAPVFKEADVNGVQVRMKWCETCQFYRPPRCSHCSICDNCVEEFDHHCPWVDNCIGRRNYKYFFFFVTSLTIFILSGFAWGILSVMVHKGQWTHVIVEFVLMGVGLLVFIPVVGLTGFHMGLICMGRTTNEHVTGKFRGVNNPYDNGCMRNCARVMCSPKKPRYLHYQLKTATVNPLADLNSRPPSQHPRGQRPISQGPMYEELDQHQQSRMPPPPPSSMPPVQQPGDPNGIQSPVSTGQGIREITV